MKQLRYLVLLLIPVWTPAQPRRIEPILVSRKMALVIGNQSYHRSPLVNPGRDAMAMSRILEELGFEVTSRQDLTLRQMSQAISEFTMHLRTGDLALLYYSGHGMQIDNDNYLNPVDLDAGDETDARYGSYSVSQLRDKLERSGARLRIVILDACRDNPFRSTRGGPVGLAPVSTAAEGTVIAYATGDNNVAEDNGRGENGLFTGYLLEALREPGLDLDGVFKRVKQNVYFGSQRKQNPYTYSNVVGEFYFRESSARVGTPAGDAEVEYWRSIRDSSDASLFRAYLRRYPQGRFVEIAEARLHTLETGPSPRQEESLRDVPMRIVYSDKRKSDAERASAVLGSLGAKVTMAPTANMQSRKGKLYYFQETGSKTAERIRMALKDIVQLEIAKGTSRSRDATFAIWVMD